MTPQELQLQELIHLFVDFKAIFEKKALPHHFKDKILFKYSQWVILNIDAAQALFGDVEKFREFAKLFLEQNWNLVKGTLLSSTAIPSSPMTQFLSLMAHFVDSHNPIQALMPGVCIEPTVQNFPLLRVLTLEDMVEVSQILKSVSVRIKNYLHDTEQLSIVEQKQVEDLDALYISALDKITNEVKDVHQISESNWMDFFHAIQKANHYLLEWGHQHQKAIKPIEEDNRILIEEFHLLSIKLRSNYSIASVLKSHILSDDCSSLVPVRSLALDNFSVNPKSIGFKPYCERYSTITPYELNRLLEHSEKTRALNEAVLKAFDCGKQGKSHLYAQLLKLCALLRREDAHSGRGSQEQVGELAFVAIADFFIFYEAISLEKKSQIPEAVRRAIESLQSVSGHYQGNMSGRIETCAGSRREQIECAIKGHDSALIAISVEDDVMADKRTAAFQVRDDLRRDLAELLQANEAGNIKYPGGHDGLSFNLTLLNELKLEFTVAHFDDLIVQFSRLSVPDLVNLLQRNQPLQEYIIRVIGGLNNLVLLSHQLRLEKLRVVLKYLSKGLKDHYISDAQSFFGLLSSHHLNEEKMRIIIFYLGNIFWLLRSENLAPLRLLLSNSSIDINQTDMHGLTALMNACKKNYLGIVRLLLQRPDINVNMREHKEHSSALLFACQKQHLEMIALLISVPSIDINIVNIKRMTPLMYACKENHYDVVRLLIAQKNIDLNIQNRKGNTALMLACANNHCDVIRLLIAEENIDINMQNRDGDTALMLACANNHCDVIRLLIAEENIDINMQNLDGDTAIMLACANNYCEAIRLLIAEENIDINVKNFDGHTVLMIACQLWDCDIVESLLTVPNIDVCACDLTGLNALMMACQEGYLDMVRLLINMPNMNLNAQESYGLTALIKAVQDGEYEIVEALLETKRVDIHIVDALGKTALDYAQNANDEDIMSLLNQLDEQEPDTKRLRVR
jgi:hypothetical protein